jgi:hypothetical protein
MSDERPLVTVEPSGALGFELRVAGRFVCADADRAALDSIALAAGAAVERREAGLREALRRYVETSHREVHPGYRAFDVRVRPEVVEQARAALGPNPPEYISGDVACAMAFDLGAMQWTQHVLMRSIDVLDAGGQVAPFLRAMGVAEREPPLREMKAGALFDELRRRGVIASVPRLRQQYAALGDPRPPMPADIWPND